MGPSRQAPRWSVIRNFHLALPGSVSIQAIVSRRELRLVGMAVVADSADHRCLSRKCVKPLRGRLKGVYDSLRLQDRGDHHQHWLTFGQRFPRQHRSQLLESVPDGLEPGDAVTISGARQLLFDTTASTPGGYVRVLTVFSSTGRNTRAGIPGRSPQHSCRASPSSTRKEGSANAHSVPPTSQVLSAPK